MQLSVIFSLFMLCSRAAAFMTATPSVQQSIAHSNLDTRRHLDIGSMISNWGKKVTASHILIGPASSKTGRGMNQDDAEARLEEMKAEIGNDPVKFAEFATEYSSCRASSSKGGDLGEFGPGMMVQPFDKVCFEEEVGVVHGPITTPFGKHLILITERTGEK